jgi:excisionase family DNA binding protein
MKEEVPHLSENNNGQLLTPDEVAKHLQVTAEQIRSLIRRGFLSAANIGAGSKRPLYRISRQTLDDFLKGRQQLNTHIPKKKIKQLSPIPDFFPGLK